jgi:hypothetical protein
MLVKAPVPERCSGPGGHDRSCQGPGGFYPALAVSAAAAGSGVVGTALADLAAVVDGDLKQRA